jgi:drug/metabolite transporter (DMT)-like permease
MGLAVFCVGPRLQVLGVHLGSAGDSSVLVAIEPLITALAAAVVLRERIPARRWAGFGLGMIGVLLLSGGWKGSIAWNSLIAYGLFLSSFVCESAYSVVGKPLLGRVHVLKLIAAATACGTAANLVIDGRSTLVKTAHLPASAWLMVAYLVVICTLVGYTLWYVVIRNADVSLAAMTILVQPLFGVLAASAFLGEPWHGGQVWGTAAILAGLGLGLLAPSAEARRSPRGPTEPDAAPTPPAAGV